MTTILFQVCRLTHESLGICDFEDVPGSIKKCKDLIRANIHINIKSYLKVKRENGSAIGQVKLVRILSFLFLFAITNYDSNLIRFLISVSKSKSSRPISP